jgi:hypothetical protein
MAGPFCPSAKAAGHLKDKSRVDAYPLYSGLNNHVSVHYLVDNLIHITFKRKTADTIINIVLFKKRNQVIVSETMFIISKLE